MRGDFRSAPHKEVNCKTAWTKTYSNKQEGNTAALLSFSIVPATSRPVEPQNAVHRARF